MTAEVTGHIQGLFTSYSFYLPRFISLLKVQPFISFSTILILNHTEKSNIDSIKI